MSETVLLTKEQVDEWMKELDSNSHQISSLTKRNEKIEKLLHAASFFMNVPHRAEEMPNTLIPSGDTEDDGITLVDAVIKVFQRAHEPLTNKQIKRGLPEVGFDGARLNESPNYFYTVTKRLKDRGAIERLSDGRYALKNTEASEGDSSSMDPSEASNERRIDYPAEPNPSSPVKPWAGGGT